MTKKNISKILLASAIFSFATMVGGFRMASAAGPNLIANPSLETPGTPSSSPSGWSKGGWGTNTAVFSYPVTGSTGVGANVTISAYTTGDEKWYFTPVAVTAKTAYTFSDSYNSTAASQLVAQYATKANVDSYVTLATLPSTNGAWVTANVSLTVPANITSATIFHLIQSKGSLTVDDYFLGTTATSTATSTPPIAVTINPSTLPDGVVGTAYSQTLTASTTATGNFTWSIASGALPAGLKLGTGKTATQTISGTPTKSASSTFAIKVVNGTASSTQSYAISIAPAPVIVYPTSTLSVIVNTVGGPKTSANFNISVAAPGAVSTTPKTFTGNASGTSVVFELPATSTQQTYTVTETNTQANYLPAQYGDGCQNQTVVVGGSAVCTITNTYVPPSATTSTLLVNLAVNGTGTALFSDFKLKVLNGTTTVFNGAASSTQNFALTIGKTFSVTEATTTNSANYAISLGSNCSGTVGTSSISCAITNTFLGVGGSSPTSTNPTSTTSNLILNPSFETAGTGGMPASWNEGGWGTNAATFNYPVAGVNGGVGANVTMTSFTNGDAKWYFNNVFVTPGATYTFSDSYNSNVVSNLTVQFTSSGGAVSYVDLATLAATNGAWATATETITAPANAAALTVFHYISSVGSLTTDNYSLVPVTNSPPELFPTGLVSLTFDDGWQSQYDNALSVLQAASMRGSFYIISDGMLNAMENIFPSTDNPFNVTTTPTATTWNQIYTDPTQHNFVFSDVYTASGPSTITVSYKISGGGASSTILGPLPAGTSSSAQFAFPLPVITGPLTIAQSVINASDTLTATSPLLVQPIGYMDATTTLALQAAGEEIGNHTVNHCDLVAINASSTNTASCAVNPPVSTTVAQQVNNAYSALTGAGFSPVDTFAYPYGDGAGNAAVEKIVKNGGMIAARGTGTGYNTKSTDHYSLLDQNVDTTVPDFATIQQWIDYAAANKVWLILTFHQVELSSSTITQNKETDATTAAMFQQTVNYLSAQRAAGKVVVDTVHNIMNQYMN